MKRQKKNRFEQTSERSVQKRRRQRYEDTKYLTNPSQNRNPKQCKHSLYSTSNNNVAQRDNNVRCILVYNANTSTHTHTHTRPFHTSNMKFVLSQACRGHSVKNILFSVSVFFSLRFYNSTQWRRDRRWRRIKTTREKEWKEEKRESKITKMNREKGIRWKSDNIFKLHTTQHSSIIIIIMKTFFMYGGSGSQTTQTKITANVGIFSRKMNMLMVRRVCVCVHLAYSRNCIRMIYPPLYSVRPA